MEKTYEELENEFYSKQFFVSYSSLNKLLYAPSLFRKWYILGQRDDRLETTAVIEGKLIHCLLLDDGSFDKQFIVMPASVPVGNNKLVVDKVFNISNSISTLLTTDVLGNYNELIIDILKEINLHQSLKTDEQRVAKIVTEENSSYFEFLKIKGTKVLIDAETLARCNEAVSVLRNNEKVTQLLGLITHETERVDIYNEYPLECPTQYKFGLKGIVDNIKINHDEKVIYINDLKTSGKTLSEFAESVKFFNYHLQAAIYKELVIHNFNGIVDEHWKLVFNFIVIDKYNQVYCFTTSKETDNFWYMTLQNRLKEFNWHYENKEYSLPQEFATQSVTL